MHDSPVTVALASTNAAKVSAASKVFSELVSRVAVHSCVVDSAVSETPASDEEAIVGCLNRLSNMGFPSGAQYAVALEGMLERRSFGSFLYGWAVVREASTRRISLGCSGKVMIPEALVAEFRSVNRLSDWISCRYPNADPEALNQLGSNGLITEGRYTRIDEFETALRCALGFLFNERNFLHEYKCSAPHVRSQAFCMAPPSSVLACGAELVQPVRAESAPDSSIAQRLHQARLL